MAQDEEFVVDSIETSSQLRPTAVIGDMAQADGFAGDRNVDEY